MAAEGNKDGQVIDIERLVDSMERILEQVPHYMCTPGHPGRISRIPESLREVAVKAYEPYHMSIGPYHHHKPGVKRMEKRKHEVLKCVLELKPEITLKDYLNELKGIELAARSFYSELEMESEEFVCMLLLDSMCILTAFCGMPRGEERKNQTNGRVVGARDNADSNDRENRINEGFWTLDADENTPIMTGIHELRDQTISEDDNEDTPRWIWFWFAHDVFLLENQLPFFVLQKIHDLVYGGCGTQLIVTLKHEFCNMLLDYTRLDSEMVLCTEDVHHLLHLCHMFFRPRIRHVFTTCDLSGSSQMFRLGSTVQLYEAGVNFEARSISTQHSLLDISLSSSGKMVIPCLYVEDNTETLLRNLIALEQMKYPSLGLNVSAYAVLLLHLVTIPDDVKLLRKKGIIQHHLSSDKEMVYFVNRLSVGLAFDYVEDNYSLKDVFQGLKSYSERRVPRWRAWLKHRYFTNPWMVIALLAASLLLFLTTLQTFYQVYSYYQPFLDSQL